MPRALRNMLVYCGKCPWPDGLCSFTVENAQGPTGYAVLLRKMPGAQQNMQFTAGNFLSKSQAELWPKVNLLPGERPPG